MGLIIIFSLIVLLIVTLPRWPYSKNWGYKYTSALGIILAVVLVLIFMDVITLADIEFEINDGTTEIEIGKIINPF